MKLSRRHLLQSLPLLGVVPAFPAYAASPTVTDRYFVFAYFGGGWDHLIALEPKDPNIFTQEDTTIKSAVCRPPLPTALL